MKHMSSTDTPLNTLSMLQNKQRSEKSPYVILSGNKTFSSNSYVHISLCGSFLGLVCAVLSNTEVAESDIETNGMI